MSASRLGWLLTAAALAAGCFSLTAAQSRSLSEVRAFADATTHAYGLQPIHVLVSHDPESPVGAYRRDFFAVNPLVLGSEFRDAIVAHELAHYVLGHDAPLSGATAEARRREREQRELDANAKAVEILARVKQIPEDDALRRVYLYLLNVHRRLQRAPGEDLLGHRPPCEEIADLLTRFPRQAVWTADLECAPPRSATGG
ncbi:MAG TPA: ImmA/IrrE family metallo-endopeptidase [Methylomirabilota bacterium]|nr:ImmA/IrrE family metallo-endopeptidase [Methylomirabilota bacterium]